MLYEFVYPQQLASVLGALHTAGIQTLLLKGYALGRFVYRQPVLRPYSDFDILIPLDCADSAARVLAGLDYQPDSMLDYPPDYRETHHHLIPFIHPSWLPVELHWRLVTPLGTMHIDMPTVWDRAQSSDLAGVPTRVLLPEHLLIYLALHAVGGHLFDIGLRALCDANELIESRDLDWDDVLATSQAWGCARQVYLLLLVLRELFGSSLPEGYLRRLSPQGVAPDFLAYCVSNLLETAVEGLEESAGLAQVWETVDPGDRWTKILTRLFPMPAEVAAAYHLRSDDWRRWLYYPRWQYMLIRRHLQTGLRLLRADPATLERARKEITRQDLLKWVSEG